MSKKCSNCGAELMDEAAFCPYCAKSQIVKTAIKAPVLWRKKVAIAVLAVFCVLFAAVILKIPTVPGIQENVHTPQSSSVEASSQSSQAEIDDMLASGTCGQSMTWELDSAGTLTISGEGEMSDYRTYHNDEVNTAEAPWKPYLMQIKTIVIKEGVTGIGEGAFYDCTFMTDVTIPESVVNIGVHAFGKCSSLTGVIIPEGIKTLEHGLFDSCFSLTSVNIPESVKTIESEAFSGCLSLTSITIPESVVSIGIGAFHACDSLSSVTIPAGVTSIRSGTFSSCRSLTSVTIPASVKSIDQEAFYGCRALKNIIFEGNAPVMDDSAFSNAAAAVYYPENDATWTADIMQDYGGTLTWRAAHAPGEHNANRLIYEKADELNHAIKAVCLGCTENYVTAVGTEPHSVGAAGDREATVFAPAYCFLCGSEYGECLELPANMVDCGMMDGLIWGLTNDGILTISGEGEMTRYASDTYTNRPWQEYRQQIKTIVIESGVTTIGGYAFCDCDNLTSVTIPESVTDIGLAAFRDCGSLTDISLPKSLSRTAGGIFSGCHSLTSVNIPEGVTCIWGSMFKECYSLTSITIPKSVNSIENYAFSDCSSLTEIIFEGGAPKISISAFTNVIATVHFSGEDTSWTMDQLQNYGGTLSWYFPHDPGKHIMNGEGYEKVDSSVMSGKRFVWAVLKIMEYLKKQSRIPLVQWVTERLPAMPPHTAPCVKASTVSALQCRRIQSIAV